jgi:hypothetical protein
MIDLPVGVNHFAKTIAFTVCPETRVHAKTLGIPAFAKAMPLVILEITSIYGPVGVGHYTEAMPLVGGGVAFSLIGGVSSVIDDDHGYRLGRS